MVGLKGWEVGGRSEPFGKGSLLGNEAQLVLGVSRGRDEPSDRRGGASRVGSLITGSGAEPQKKILPLKRFFRTKNACSEDQDVKHLVQKLSSRPPHESGHTA